MPSKTTSQNNTELPIVQPKAPTGKTGRGKIRAGVLIVVHVVLLLHITHYFLTGRSVSPIEPSESRYTLEFGHLNAGTIFFGLAIVSTAIFGRFFCGWACHIVALQDLSSYILRRIGIRPKPLRSRLLVFAPFAVAFYMFFWPTIQRLWQGKPHPGITNHLLTENFWLTFPGPAVAILTFVVCGGLIVYLLGNKGFCTYVCPYGAFFSVSDQLAVGRIRVTDACRHCGKCTAACTSNVSIHSEVKDFGMVVDPGCMKCMDCVSVCPNDALYFGFKQANNIEAANNTSPTSSRKKNYDFSIAEELLGMFVAIIVIYGLKGLYNFSPLLLIVALSIISAYLAIQLLRIFRKRDLRLQNFQLKRNHRMTKFGVLAIVLICGWFAFNIHSCYVQYHRHRGRDRLSKIQITWQELLYSDRPSQFTAEDHANVDSALLSFQLTDNAGFVDVMEVKRGLAFVNMMKNKMDIAEQYWREAYDCDPNAVRELISEFFASQGRTKEAQKFL